MKIEPVKGAKYGADIYEFDLHNATSEQIHCIKDAVYKHNIVMLKNQNLSPKEYVELGNLLGEPEAYYEPMYHHPEEKEIFVSSNVSHNGETRGVPKTGKFWHADYSFMRKPFAFTMIYPRVVPKGSRGTYFIDMAEAYNGLSDKLKSRLNGTIGCHSARKYFKIRPSDVYRPIVELLAEIEVETPEVYHPATFIHPITKERILYISAALTQDLRDEHGHIIEDDFFQALLEASGQLDMSFQSPLIHTQTFCNTDILIWDNRQLIHRALHTTTPEPTESYRLTLHDDYPFYEGIDLATPT